MDFKHIIAAAVGIILGVAGTYFGIDFTKSCPSVAPVVPASAVAK